MPFFVNEMINVFSEIQKVKKIKKLNLKILKRKYQNKI